MSTTFLDYETPYADRPMEGEEVHVTALDYATPYVDLAEGSQ